MCGHVSKGTPLTSATCGTNIALSSRSIAKLNVTSATQAHNLVTFSNYARKLGNGLVVLDFGSRIVNVHKSYKADGDWERELFIESSSFVASTVAATITVNVGTAALGFLMIATPVGWIGLIVGGLVVAGAVATYNLHRNK